MCINLNSYLYLVLGMWVYLNFEPQGKINGVPSNFLRSVMIKNIVCT